MRWWRGWCQEPVDTEDCGFHNEGPGDVGDHRQESAVELAKFKTARVRETRHGWEPA